MMEPYRPMTKGFPFFYRFLTLFLPFVDHLLTVCGPAVNQVGEWDLLFS